VEAWARGARVLFFAHVVTFYCHHQPPPATSSQQHMLLRSPYILVFNNSLLVVFSSVVAILRLFDRQLYRIGPKEGQKKVQQPALKTWLPLSL
jgi:hypothetical protein